MSYGADVPELFQRSASYVQRILRGSKPAELPVEQPTKFNLAINLKTAKEIGLAIPGAFLLRAEEVIERGDVGALCFPTICRRWPCGCKQFERNGLKDGQSEAKPIYGYP